MAVAANNEAFLSMNFPDMVKTPKISQKKPQKGLLFLNGSSGRIESGKKLPSPYFGLLPSWSNFVLIRNINFNINSYAL
ncbi:MAG: hypothetical protein COV36_08000 [Alphaproteobacteria bacterium CG11_big_fil_rev_8_21_14_0_20_44_7]|nr:MAG: hypothetical protein COV36_08000 [Alphaproteobacteria bacterium CG11_big_fil_rev_8_21_14_0_20_44_7]